MRRYLILVVAFLLSCAGVFAQDTATGYPPYGSFENGNFDNVNLYDLDFILTIPVVSTPGRGMNFNLDLVYNSLNWINLDGAWSFITNSDYGWQLDTPTGQEQYRYLTGKTICGRIDGLPYYTYTYTYENYEYIDPFGTTHPFSVDWSQSDNTCTNQITTSGTYTGYATDGSGYYANVSEGGLGTIISPAGITVYSTGMTDTNGNFISSSTSGDETDWTDSAGHVAAKVITGASTTQYEYYDSTGNLQTATLNFTSEHVKTNFGCSGVIEYSNTESLPTSLVLANGQSYAFAYEPTPGYSGYVTGRLSQVTLPTGGTISYAYGEPNDGINCADGSIMNVTRTVNDGVDPSSTWSYFRDDAGNTQENDPVTSYGPGGQIIATFNSSGQETQRVISQGTSMLRTINTTWASNGSPATQTTILNDGKTESETETTYDNYGNLDLLKEHDYGSGSPGAVVRTTTINYLNTSAYVAANILNRPISIFLDNVSGAVQSLTEIAYDQTGYINQNCPSPNPPQHISDCSSIVRGDPTSVTSYTNAQNETGPVRHYTSYDSLGNALTATIDGKQQQKWSFSSATNYSYPDSETAGQSGGTQLTTSYTYSSYDGQLLSVTGPNNDKTSYAYDAMKRPTVVTRPDNAQVTYTYNDATPPTLTTENPVQGNFSIAQITNYDELARPAETTIQDVFHNTYSIVQTKYDPVGRAYEVSDPYTGSPQYWTETEYDALNRITDVILPDNSQTTYAYSANSVTTTDPAGKQRQMLTDALGRTSAVYEPDPTNNNSLTNLTSYAYTVNDALASVSEGAQTRSYNYDGLGNLTSETTPEAGSVQYQYNDLGLATQRTDARSVATNYTYDTLNRLTGITYTLPQGSQVAQMPNVCNPQSGSAIDNVCFYYDQGGAGANALGRLTQMSFALGNQNNPPTGTDTYSYDVLGRSTEVQYAIGGYTFPVTYAYNGASEITSITYPSGRVVQQSMDGIGRLCEVAPSTGGCGTAGNPFATGYQYNAANLVIGFKYGNGVYGSFGFSPDRLQLNCLDYSTTNRGGSCTHDSTTEFGLTYSYGSIGSNDGLISGISDYEQSGRSITYSYDALYRLVSAATTGSSSYPAWGLSETYDRYGNRWAQSISSGCSGITCPTASVSISATTNQITSSPETYDASGNMTNDGSNTITYDAESRPVTVSGGSSTYIYDGNGLRVKKTASGTPTVYVFSGSKVIAEYANGNGPSSPSTEYIYGGGMLLASVGSAGTLYFHRDHLSNRMITSSSGGVYSNLGHFPFGEQWYDSTYSKWYFTSYEYDEESGNHYATFRSYVNRLGRFSTPDPIGGDPSNPQSFDRYAYVLNGPCDLVDELGLAACDFNVKIHNQAGLSNSEIKAVEDYIKSIFSASSAFQPNSVGVNFVTSGQADFTLTYGEALGQNPSWGGLTKPGSNTGQVFVNHVPPSIFYSDAQFGVLGAHEMGHGLGVFQDTNYNSAGSTLMSINTNPNWLSGSAQSPLVNNFPFGTLFTSKQLGQLYARCNQLHSPTASGGGGGFLEPAWEQILLDPLLIPPATITVTQSFGTCNGGPVDQNGGCVNSD